MITLRHTVSALAVSTLLVLGACKKKDSVTDDTAVNTVEKSADKVKGAISGLADPVTKSDLNKQFNIKSKSKAGSDQALEILGLAEQSGTLSWQKKAEKSGNVVYNNLSYKSPDNKDFQANKVELIGAHMDGDNASFDAMILSGVSMNEDGSETSIKTLKMRDPHPKLAARIMSGIGELGDLDKIDMDVELDGQPPFGAFLMEGISNTNDKGTGSVDVLGWSVDEAEDKGSFLLSGVNLSSTSDKGTPFTMTLDTVSISGVSADMIHGLGKGGASGGGAGNGFDMMKSGFGEVLIRDIKVNADNMTMNFAGVEGSSKTKGDVSTQRMVMKPMSIKFDGLATDMNLLSAQEQFDKLGFEELVLSGEFNSSRNKAKDEVSVQRSFLKLKDGFDLNFSGKMSGVKAAETDPSKSMIHNLSIEMTDVAFLEKAFEIAGQENGVSSQEMRQQIAGLISMASLMGQAPAQLTTPLAKFITDGGSIKINMNPPVPVQAQKLATISGPEDLQWVGLSVEHNQ